MVKIRAILAGLIALAVAVAPVAAGLVASAAARTASAAMTAAHDCHGSARHHDKGPHHSDKADCPDCQDQHQTKNCVGDGGKCCKLTGMVAALPIVLAPAENVDLAASPPTLTGWQARPPPPPPRA
jgi:hypothetical protein